MGRSRKNVNCYQCSRTNNYFLEKYRDVVDLHMCSQCCNLIKKHLFQENFGLYLAILCSENSNIIRYFKFPKASLP